MTDKTAREILREWSIDMHGAKFGRLAVKGISQTNKIWRMENRA